MAKEGGDKDLERNVEGSRKKGGKIKDFQWKKYY